MTVNRTLETQTSSRAYTDSAVETWTWQDGRERGPGIIKRMSWRGKWEMEEVILI